MGSVQAGDARRGEHQGQHRVRSRKRRRGARRQVEEVAERGRALKGMGRGRRRLRCLPCGQWCLIANAHCWNVFYSSYHLFISISHTHPSGNCILSYYDYPWTEQNFDDHVVKCKLKDSYRLNFFSGSDFFLPPRPLLPPPRPPRPLPRPFPRADSFLKGTNADAFELVLTSSPLSPDTGAMRGSRY